MMVYNKAHIESHRAENFRLSLQDAGLSKRKAWMKRPALSKKLNAGAQSKLMSIHAPQGWGKTSLVKLWVQENKTNSFAWITLSKADNDLSLFIQKLISALQLFFPKSQGILNPVVPGSDNLDWKTILVELLDKISLLPEKRYLIFDDLQSIFSKSILDSIRYLIMHSPEKLHIIIISDYFAGVSLSRFRAAGILYEITYDDLRLSRKETGRFIKTVLNTALAPEQLDTIYRRSEGWILGVQMLVGKIKKGQQSKACGKKSIVEDYFDQLIPEQQLFLLKISFLEQFSLEMCSLLTEIADVAGMIRAINKHFQVFVLLDNAGEWYRLHNLFKDFLKRRSASFNTVDTGEINSIAAIWYSDNGYLEDAFRHAFLIPDSVLAVRLLGTHLLPIIVNNKFNIADRWLDRLPEKHLKTNPGLLLHKILSQFLQYNFESIQEELNYAEQIFTDMENKYALKDKYFICDLFIVLRTVNQYRMSPSNKNAAALKHTRDKISVDSIFARSYMHLVYIRHLTDRCDIRNVREFTGLDYENIIQEGYIYTALSGILVMADAELLQGKLLESKKKISRARALFENNDLKTRAAVARINIRLAKIYFLEDKMDEALVCIRDCLSQGKPAKAYSCLAFAYYLESLIRFDQKDFHLAQDLMEMAESFAGKCSSVFQAEAKTVSLGLFRIRVLSRNRVDAGFCVQKRDIKADEPFSGFFEEECLLTAECFLLLEEYSKAAGLMYSLRPRSEKRGRFLAVLRIDIIRAAALYMDGCGKEAEEVLDHAVKFAMPENIVRPFTDFSGPVCGILLNLQAKAGLSDRIFIKHLLKLCWAKKNLMPANQKITHKYPDPLTPRETELCMLISAGLKNKDILEIAGISKGTLKTHIKNIYGKLGVENRAQAIAKAGEIKSRFY